MQADVRIKFDFNGRHGTPVELSKSVGENPLEMNSRLRHEQLKEAEEARKRYPALFRTGSYYLALVAVVNHSVEMSPKSLTEQRMQYAKARSPRRHALRCPAKLKALSRLRSFERQKQICVV